MGYIIPGGRFHRFGDTLINHNTQSNVIPSTKPIVTNSIGDVQRRIARARSVTAATDISRTAPTFNDPRYTFTTLSIPTDLRTLNGLYRFFDDTDPVVGNSLRLHSEFPLSRVSLKDIGDVVISDHYHDMWNRIQMEKLLFDIALEYWRIGNVFSYGAWNVDDLMWDQFVILNPDYVTVEGTYLNQKPFIKLQPDEHLKRVVTTGQPKFLYDQLPKEIIKYIRMGQEIPLSPNNVFHIAHNKAPYETLGRSIIKRILKSLIYEDRMSMANFAIATRQTIPITVVKLGDPASVEEDHFVNFKENNELKVMSFKDMWEKYSGPITEHGENKQTKYVGTYNLFTLSQNSNGSQTWNKIEHILRHPTPNEIVKVNTPLATLRMTEGHGLYWINPHTGKYEMVTPGALRLRENPTIVTMDRFDYSIKADKVFGLNLTPDLSYLLGLWTADGSFEGWKNKSGKHVSNKKIKISNSDKGIGRYLISKYTATEYRSARDTVYYFYHEIVEALVNYYEVPKEGTIAKSGREKVPQEILFNYDDKIVGAFLAGLFDGDGYLSKNPHNIGVMCGSSKEFAHWISLALLGKGILSQTVFRSNAWEVLVSGKRDILKYLDLIEPYIQHNKKKTRAIHYRKHFTDINGRQNKIYIHDIADNVLNILFANTPARIHHGALPLNYLKKKPRVTCSTIQRCAVPCTEKSIYQNLCGVSISSLQNEKKQSEYVYDLMLENNPHTFLTAGEGWCLSSNSGWVPEDSELEEFRELMSARETDPNFSIVYHWGIDIQFYGAGGKIWNLTNEFNRIMKWKLLGLGISENILTGGGSYASAYAQLEVLRQRYLHFQTTLQNFVYSGMFEPVAAACGFYKTSSVTSGRYYQGKRFGADNDELTKISAELSKHQGIYTNDESQEYVNRLLQKQAEATSKVEYVYPKLDWDLLSLSNDVQYKSFLMNFDRLFPGQRKISDQTFYAAARLDPEAEKTKIEREFKQGLEDKLEKARILKEYKQKFIDEGLPIPLDIEPKPVGPGAPGSPGSPGPGGSIVPPGGVPQLGGTGGGNLPGAPAMVPNAPIGKGQFEGAPPKTPRTPEASRLKSQQIHEHLTNAALDIDKENKEEVLRLRKFNKEAGIPVDQIDTEAKINAESKKKENSTES